MKTVLCDINFFLDIFLKRDPFYNATANLFMRIEAGEVKGYICALSFPTLFYILSKELKKEKAVKTLNKIRTIFHVANVDEKIIDLSLLSDFKDFEDAIQYYSAMRVKANFIITRDKSDYLLHEIPALTPDEYLALQDI